MNKHTNTLRELSKFLAGLVTADLIGAIWFLMARIPDIKVFGLTITSSFAGLGVAFDIFLLLVLIHYAWHPKILEPHISRRVLFILIGIITCVVSILHIGRLAFNLDLVLGNWHAPMWLSWFGALITAYIS